MTAKGNLTMSGNSSRISTATSGTGSAGNVTVETGALTVQDAAAIAASTSGPGQGGDVSVTAKGDIAIRTGGAVSASATKPGGSGGSGSITISSDGDLTLVGSGPEITARSVSSGGAGKITVSAAKLRMSGGASISTDASTANGGNIALMVQDLIDLQHSSIKTSVGGGTGNGGKITIDPPHVLVLRDASSVDASAQGGNGGHIIINEQGFIQSLDSTVAATGGLSNGTISIGATARIVTTPLAELAARFSAPLAINRIDCASVAERVGISGLTQGGRGGPPQDGSGPQFTRYFAGHPLPDAPGTETRAGLLTPVAQPPALLSLAEGEPDQAACR
ncbi:MAG: hypothetical protein JOZ17_12855 [Acetobacteraceae bacterium]|nr:hypothetical protein [Acetobacteraceae bacterium]